MMKTLLISTAVSGLMLSAAFAQSPNPSAPPKAAPPAASQTQDKSAATPAKPDKTAKADTSGSASAEKVVSSQSPDQLLASKFKGTDVIGADNKKIGDVSDILFDKDGKILAYVVSIGGFLGIGSKNVAMAPSAFQIEKGTNGGADKLKISMSQDQLKKMASFKAYQPPRATTTGSAPGGGGVGRPGPMGGATH
jgi:sporulation protein YlmC with PRC-barrel domain